VVQLSKVSELFELHQAELAPTRVLAHAQLQQRVQNSNF
jgi:hypothetical protein